MTRPHLVRWFRIASSLTVVLVLLQAFMAGRGMFVNPDLLEDHGSVGNFTFLIVLIQAGLLLGIGLQEPLRSRLLVLNGLLVVLVIAQLGLGYSGRDNATAASWHVPNGVLIFGLSCFNMALAALVPRSPAA